MTKRRLIILCVVVAITATGVVTWFQSQAKPSYQGRRLSTWLREINGDWPPKTSSEVDIAIRHMGTNSFPALEKMMNSKDSPLYLKLGNFFRRHRSLKYDLPTLMERQAKVLTVIHLLGPAGKPFVPVLVENLGRMDDGIGLTACVLLEEMGPEAEAAMPALIKVVNGNNNVLRPSAMQALARISFRHPEAVKPVFEKYLGDPDLVIQVAAKNSLMGLQYYQQNGGSNGLPQ